MRARTIGILSILAVFIILGLVAGFIAIPSQPVYTIREDSGSRPAQPPMYWVYSRTWPLGLGMQFEAGFDSREAAREYVDRARARDEAERRGTLVEEDFR